MIRAASRAMLLAMLAVGAWAAEGPGSAVAAPAAAPAAAPVGPIGRWLQPSWTAISPDARIFLVAGSRDKIGRAHV